MSTHTQIKSNLISRDPKLERLFNEVPELDFNTLYKPPYISLVGAIIGQQISYRQARAIRSKLYDLINKKSNSNNCMYCNAVALEAIPDIELLSIGITRHKLNIIRNLNTYLIKNGWVYYSLDVEQIISTIRINGISDWTIQTTMLTSFMDWNIFPSGDLFLQNKIKKLYNLKKKPTPYEVEKIAVNWKPYKTFVCWYMWRWLN